MAYCARFACGSAGGEVDVRGAYTALATAHMLKLDKVALAKQAGVVQYVCKCQVEHLNGCCPLCRNSTHLHHLSTKCNTLVISPPDALHLLCHVGATELPNQLYLHVGKPVGAELKSRLDGKHISILAWA